MSADLPQWAQDLARTYQGGVVNTFLLHGNVHDLCAIREGNSLRFVGLKEFLIKTMFPRRESVICYDQSAGIWFPQTSMREDFAKVVKAVDTVQGTNYSDRLPREPARALPLIERFLRTRIMDKPNYRAAVLIDYSHFIAPASLGSSFSQDEAATLITLHKWSSDPAFTKADITIVLITENLADLHPLLVRSPHTTKVQIALPDQSERLEYLRAIASDAEISRISALTLEEISVHTSGLSRVNLAQLLAHARTEAETPTIDGKPITGSENRTIRKLDLDSLFNEKKTIIEKECYGLLEFIKPRRGLDSVSGHEAAKAWLKEDARLLKEGKLEALPMGYLICGPVGTGKTYMMMCYAGTLGIPCVKLMNFRSQWQGVTEGNWEKILNTLKATGPVAVIIDEADAAVGNRDNSGDSGTSSRVFSMLAQQMGDTNYRGKILWFLLTCRPDLLPIDLKRQGRAEVHIPLFYPQGDAEVRTYFTILAKKSGATLEPKDVPDTALKMKLSGSDIEGVVIRAKRRAFLANSPTIRAEDLAKELEVFTPTVNSDEVELQVMAAVVESTHQDFLTPELQKLDRQQAAKRLAVLKQIVGR
ncbi:MAG TPA: AAA family ATPase [Planctomycetota bacterium]|nr:AAA family ATPase [Planctomycetota bacterium]